MFLINRCNRVHCVCPGPWPFNLFFPVVLSLFWLGGSFMVLIIWSVKTCALGPPRPLNPSVPTEASRPLDSILRTTSPYFWATNMKVDQSDAQQGSLDVRVKKLGLDDRTPIGSGYSTKSPNKKVFAISSERKVETRQYLQSQALSPNSYMEKNRLLWPSWVFCSSKT